MKKIADYQVSLKVFLKNNDGKTLILKTPTNCSFLGKYDFPGGRIDEDEFEVSYENILKREIFEELGNVKVELKPKVVAIGRHLHKDKNILYLFFDGIIINSCNITISHEALGYDFVDLNNIDLEEYFISGILEAVKMYLSKE